MQIGRYKLESPVICAPMAGVTDRPFRQMARKWGAALAVSEMLSSNPDLWHTEKSRNRMDHSGESGIRAVQIAGSEPELMAKAAQHNVAQGAQIVDINMGCPAKKVNKKLAGSALMKDPDLIESIVTAVVNAVDVPVTLKMRTGWAPDNRNGVDIARRIANRGIQALTVHGRTRACAYRGQAEYDTIRAIKQAVDIPVIANGDIVSAQQARQVMDYTGADAIMIGRGAQGRPWLFEQTAHHLKTGKELPDPPLHKQMQVLLNHVQALHDFYGPVKGLRIARKHVGWFVEPFDQPRKFRVTFNSIETEHQQLAEIAAFYKSILS
ncbi:tRNA dihydrouridine synthase DusB [Echinimonas agarilytica]|uniref:tRNA-dihydrouridine synthase B n=1 Tax=Echinimonas agarilytica TaxID=1215918 RepID=A0AA41W427_9GAMM|nr:tRNA dihydrouridine synthase DusB [Echinimonas agarilytica]